MTGYGAAALETGNAQVSGGTHAGQGVFCMLGWRWGIPGWEDDLVRQQGECLWMERQGRSGMTPRTEIGRQEEGAGRAQK